MLWFLLDEDDNVEDEAHETVDVDEDADEVDDVDEDGDEDDDDEDVIMTGCCKVGGCNEVGVVGVVFITGIVVDDLEILFLLQVVEVDESIFSLIIIGVLGFPFTTVS